MFQPRPDRSRRRFWSIMAVGVPWVLGVTVLVAVERVQSDGWLTRSLLDLWSETSASFSTHGLAMDEAPEAPMPPQYFAFNPDRLSSPKPFVWHSEHGLKVPTYPTSPASAAPSPGVIRAAAAAEHAVAMVDAKSLQRRIREAHSYRPNLNQRQSAGQSQRERQVQAEIERALDSLPAELDELRDLHPKITNELGRVTGSYVTSPAPSCSKNTISIDG